MLISEQIMDLSWRDAWRHELRGEHGEWLRGDRVVDVAKNIDGNPLIPDPGRLAAAESEVNHGLDIQAKWVPDVVKDEQVHLVDMPVAMEDVQGETVLDDKGDDEVLIDRSVTAAVGNSTRKWGGTPAQLLQREVKKSWWVPTDPQYTLADHIVGHETGHVVADKVKALQTGEDPAAAMDAVWKPMARSLGVQPPDIFGEAEMRIVNLGGWLFADGVGKAISNGVSKYAASSKDELMAELWTEYTMNAHPRPPAKLYGDFVLAQLKAQGASLQPWQNVMGRI